MKSVDRRTVLAGLASIPIVAKAGQCRHHRWRREKHSFNVECLDCCLTMDLNDWHEKIQPDLPYPRVMTANDSGAIWRFGHKAQAQIDAIRKYSPARYAVR